MKTNLRYVGKQLGNCPPVGCDWNHHFAVGFGHWLWSDLRWKKSMVHSLRIPGQKIIGKLTGNKLLTKIEKRRQRIEGQ